MINDKKYLRICLIFAAILFAISSIAGRPISKTDYRIEKMHHSVSSDSPDEVIPEGVEKDEIDSSGTAEEKTAIGDSLRIDNLERPFTKSDMVYHPETDMVKISVAAGSDYYYFTIHLSGTDKEKGYPSAFYGIEIDTDLDLRGDTLLWVKGGQNTQWSSEDVKIYKDLNGDVGGKTAVIPDAFSGDGYETQVYPAADQSNSDSAWKRMPSDANDTIQLAIRKSIIDKDYFLWKAWADEGVANPALFDYNDAFSNTQAGSPDKNNSVYPIKELELVDSTCWTAYGFQPTRNQTGCCYREPPKVKVKKQGEPLPLPR